MTSPAMPAIAGMTTSRISRRLLLKRPDRGFFLAPASAGGAACSPGNLSTGSAIAALPGLARLASGLVGRADVLLDQLELHQQAVSVGGLQVRHRGRVDLVTQRAQLHHHWPGRRRQVKTV